MNRNNTVEPNLSKATYEPPRVLSIEAKAIVESLGPAYALYGSITGGGTGGGGGSIGG